MCLVCTGGESGNGELLLHGNVRFADLPAQPRGRAADGLGNRVRGAGRGRHSIQGIHSISLHIYTDTSLTYPTCSQLLVYDRQVASLNEWSRQREKKLSRLRDIDRQILQVRDVRSKMWVHSVAGGKHSTAPDQT